MCSDSSGVAFAQVIVIGGVDGGSSSFALQLLSSWGANVHAVTTSNQYNTTALGASKVIDPRKLSFSETWPDFDLVLDALGSSLPTVSPQKNPPRLYAKETND